MTLAELYPPAATLRPATLQQLPGTGYRDQPDCEGWWCPDWLTGITTNTALCVLPNIEGRLVVYDWDGGIDPTPVGNLAHHNGWIGPFRINGIQNVVQRSATDCLRCAVAQLINRPYQLVPDFVASHGVEWPTALEAWLKLLGWQFIMPGSLEFLWMPMATKILAQGYLVGSSVWHLTGTCRAGICSSFAIYPRGGW